ncbi:hypothetical protein U0070_012211 [Myodes glareolus]|uniref:Uncharacterized protein n=1 Tax=Myodes glareolus TaxID=447135 RepID=A0AAW0I408_MYOGA
MYGWKVYKLNVGCLSDAKQVVSLRHNQCDGDETCSYDNLLPGEQAGPRHAERRWQVRGPVHAVEMLCEQPHHCAKDHTSIQINVTEVDRVTSQFNGQFKTYAICGAICRMASRVAGTTGVYHQAPPRLEAKQVKTAVLISSRIISDMVPVNRHSISSDMAPIGWDLPVFSLEGSLGSWAWRVELLRINLVKVPRWEVVKEAHYGVATLPFLAGFSSSLAAQATVRFDLCLRSQRDAERWALTVLVLAALWPTKACKAKLISLSSWYDMLACRQTVLEKELRVEKKLHLDPQLVTGCMPMELEHFQTMLKSKLNVLTLKKEPMPAVIFHEPEAIELCTTTPLMKTRTHSGCKVLDMGPTVFLLSLLGSGQNVDKSHCVFMEFELLLSHTSKSLTSAVSLKSGHAPFSFPQGTELAPLQAPPKDFDVLFYCETHPEMCFTDLQDIDQSDGADSGAVTVTRSSVQSTLSPLLLIVPNPLNQGYLREELFPPREHDQVIVSLERKELNVKKTGSEAITHYIHSHTHSLRQDLSRKLSSLIHLLHRAVEKSKRGICRYDHGARRHTSIYFISNFITVTGKVQEDFETQKPK